MSLSPTRRRMLALMSAALLVRPSRARAESESESCSSPQNRMGIWEATASETRAAITTNESDGIVFADGVSHGDYWSTISFDLLSGRFESGFYAKTPPKSEYVVTFASSSRPEAVASFKVRGVSEDGDEGRPMIVLTIPDIFSSAAGVFEADGEIRIAATRNDVTLWKLKGGAAAFREMRQWAEAKHKWLKKDAAEKGRCFKEREAHKNDDSEPCFFTTACCGAIGLADDCFELQALRRFRDVWLAHRPGGRAVIQRYYDRAPVVLAAMRERGEAHLLPGYWLSHIVPAAVTARLGWFGLTNVVYTDLIRQLERRYLAL